MSRDCCFEIARAWNGVRWQRESRRQQLVTGFFLLSLNQNFKGRRPRVAGFFVWIGIWNHQKFDLQNKVKSSRHSLTKSWPPRQKWNTVTPVGLRFNSLKRAACPWKRSPMGLVLQSRRNMLGQLFSSVSSASKVLWKTNPVNCLWWRTLNKSFYIEKEGSTNQHFWVLWTIVQPPHLKIVRKVCNYDSNFASIWLFHELSWARIYRSSLSINFVAKIQPQET